jgi:hypothetical protein
MVRGPIPDSPEVMEARAEAKARADEREQARREEAARALAAEKESMKRSWLEAGGDEKEFEKSWPEMRATLLAERALEQQRAAQQATVNYYQRIF